MDSAKSLKYVYVRINLWVLLFLEFFASHSVCTTVAWGTRRWVKLVDEVGSAIFNWNSYLIFATGLFITKAYHPGNFTIFHWRMSTIQPARVGCFTFECWYTCCWHFCSCSSHKTIPSFVELFVTQLWAINRCRVTALSIGLAQFFIIITRID